MKRYAPVLTLLAVATLGGVLFAVNALSEPAPPTVAAAAPAASSAPVEPVPPPPPPEPAPPVVAERAFAGRSSGNEVTVAVAVKDGRAVAYVCDGKKVEAWLEGTLVGDQLSLTGARDATLTGTVTEAAALGSVSVGGKQWPYAAQGVQAPAGLYEGRVSVNGVTTRIGWVVEGDGRVTGNARPAGSPEPVPAPPLDPTAPGAVTLDGAQVSVIVVGGDLAGPSR
jgi:xanthosine utilization system XapX-like protein